MHGRYGTILVAYASPVLVVTIAEGCEAQTADPIITTGGRTIRPAPVRLTNGRTDPEAVIAAGLTRPSIAVPCALANETRRAIVAQRLVFGLLFHRAPPFPNLISFLTSLGKSSSATDTAALISPSA